jgi:Putative beta-barrel porin-2, OmpL-like. bbp2
LLNYWITNGTQQTEPFNGFKDQLFGLNLQPNKNISWTVNYYLGQEHPDFRYLPGLTQPGTLFQQGIPFEPIVNPPNGKLHIFDSYVTWTATPKLTLLAEGDYVIQRELTTSSPAHAAGGALYARYQLARSMAVAGRPEYVSDAVDSSQACHRHSKKRPSRSNKGLPMGSC